jgi:hypothetical protein
MEGKQTEQVAKLQGGMDIGALMPLSLKQVQSRGRLILFHDHPLLARFFEASAHAQDVISEEGSYRFLRFGT